MHTTHLACTRASPFPLGPPLYLPFIRGEGPDDRLGARVRVREDQRGDRNGGVRLGHEHRERAANRRPALRGEKLRGREGPPFC